MTKNTTIHDVAKKANVSVATVSRVLNSPNTVSDNKRQLVNDAIKALNYTPNEHAKALAENQINTIGVMVADVTEPFFATLVKSVDKVAQNYQKHILIGLGYHQIEKERQAIEQLLRKRCRCLVVHSKMLSDETLSYYLKQVPGMVLINRVIKGFEDRCVSLDNIQGTFLATKLLINLGHTAIGYIGSNHNIADENERLAGFKQAMDYHQLTIPSSRVIEEAPNFEGGEKAMIKLLSLNRELSAVVTYNDEMAAGAISVLNENNYKVPEDFSIVGFDDMPIARYLIPKLTTIRYPIDLMATYATELALSLVEKDINPPSQTQFLPTLVKRFSTNRR